MAMTKKRRVPEVLWRVYQNRALTLADTIISLLPPPPPPSSSADCLRCKGILCLGCSGMSFLLRPKDPSDYKDLLNNCFVVVSENAPPITDFHPDHRWSQRMIVRRIIELIMCESRKSANAICNGYDKFTQSSYVMDLLTTSAWSLLLMRIGDEVMVHVLKFASIFLPLPRQKHHQVAGIPVSLIFPKLSKRTSESAYAQPLCFESGPSRKRKKTAIADKSQSDIICAQRSNSSLVSNSPIGSSTCHVDCSHSKHNSSFCSDRSRKQSQISFFEMTKLQTSTTINTQRMKPNGVPQVSSSKARKESRKRLRPFSWQRCKKRRKVNFAEDTAMTSCFSTQKYAQPLCFESGSLQKRKKTAITDKSESDIICAQRSTSSLGSDSSIGSDACHADCNHSKDNNPFFSEPLGKHSRLGFFEMTKLKTCTTVDTQRMKSNGVPQLSSSKARTKSKKHSKPFSCQRPKKCRQVNFAKDSAMTSCISTQKCEEKLIGKLQKNSGTNITCHHEKELSCLEFEKQCKHCSHSKICFCSLMLQAQQKVAMGKQINRKSLFYHSSGLPSLFPKNHVLMTLKPDDSGAVLLMKDILGLSDWDLISESMPCFHSRSCFLGHPCLYQSLKQLIGKARRCQYLKLLDKHCAGSAIPPLAKEEHVAILEGDKSQMKLLEERHDSFKQECNPPLENFHALVNRCQSKQQNRTQRSCDQRLDLSGSYCQKNQVVSFVWAVCRRLVPRELLGAPTEWRALRKNISKFIRLRRFEKFSAKQCVHGLQTSSFPLLSSKHLSCCLNNCVPEGANTLIGCNKISNVKSILKQKLFVCWIYWFFQCIVAPILQASFYITESDVGRSNIFYYPKPIWENRTGKAITYLTERNYRLLDDKVLQHILSKRSFGFSKVRFCPKESGVRILANLRAPARISFEKKTPLQGWSLNDHFTRTKKRGMKFFKPVNNALRDLSVVLKGIKMNHPEKLGSSVFDYNDVYKKLCPFLIGLKNRFRSMPSAFVVICDVSKAFDSIDQDKLLTVMKDVILDDEYHVKLSSQVVCTKKCMRVHNDQTLLDQNGNTCITRSTGSFPFHSLHSVRINQETSRKVRKEELYRDLHELVKRNVLQLGHDFYLQEVGIPQGSIVSSLLCSFYYAHLETNVIFPFLDNIQETCYLEDTKGKLREKHTCQGDDSAENSLKYDISSSPNHILLRFTDDFLFISTSMKHATSFFSRLLRGVRAYNCSINEAKSCMNFDIDSISGFPKNKIYTGEDGISFLPWSGLLLNYCTLEIQADYTRYIGIHLSSTLTVSWQRKPGCHLKEKLRQYMRPKCHPVFYDSNINSASIVRLNVYQAFLLCAMKFHCYVCDLSNTGSLDAECYFGMIKSLLRYMYTLIVRRMCSENNGTEVRPILNLKKEEVKWLGFNAFIRVLMKKQSRHPELLSLLRSELLTHGRMGSASLKYAVDDSHSSLFWKIKY